MMIGVITIFFPDNSASPTGFDANPVVLDRDAWSYLGEQTAKALDSALARVRQATTEIAAFAKTHPK